MRVNLSERDELVEGHMQAALKAAKNWARRYRYLRDEFESAALLALVETANTHTEEHGPFLTRLNAAIRNKMHDVLRAESKHQADRVELPGDESPTTGEPTIEDLIAGAERAAEG